MTSEPQPKLTLASRLRIATDVVMQDVAGESVLLDLRTERYYGLDEIGTAMLAAVRDGGTAQAAYEAALAGYEVDGQTLERDLLELLQELVRHGLLEATS